MDPVGKKKRDFEEKRGGLAVGRAVKRYAGMNKHRRLMLLATTEGQRP